MQGGNIRNADGKFIFSENVPFFRQHFFRLSVIGWLAAEHMAQDPHRTPTSRVAETSVNKRLYYSGLFQDSPSNWRTLGDNFSIILDGSDCLSKVH